MTSNSRTNSAKGQHSYDAKVGDLIVPFFNKNTSQYPTEAGSVKFELVPVTQQKDLMINHARLYAQQEYDRIMELVAVLEKQAADIKRRLDITDAVYAAEYQFQLVMGQCYWLVQDQLKSKTILTATGPNDWTTAAPVHYQYVAQVKYMGDHTWMEVIA